MTQTMTPQAHEVIRGIASTLRARGLQNIEEHSDKIVITLADPTPPRAGKEKAWVEVKCWMGSFTVCLRTEGWDSKTTTYIDKDLHPTSKVIRWGYQKYTAVEAIQRLAKAVLACPVPQYNRTAGLQPNCDSCVRQPTCLALTSGGR